MIQLGDGASGGDERLNPQSQVSPIIQSILGRKATRFAELAMRNAAIFRGEQPVPRV
jgi:hypothetical protein